MNDDDALRQIARQVFAGGRSVPADVTVTPMTDAELRAHYLELNERFAGGAYPGQITLPGEVVEDVDGVPMSMAPARSFDGWIGPPVIAERELRRLGLHPEDVPNLPVHDDHYRLIQNPDERND